MSKAGKIVVPVLCAFLAVALISAFFLYNQNLRLQTEVQTLKKDKLSLQSQLDALQKERENLQALAHKFQSEYTELQVACKALELNYTSLRGEFELLNESYVALEAKYMTLNSEYQSLNEEFNSLSANYTELLSNSESLSGEYAALHHEYDQLVASHNNLVENYERWRAYAETYFSFTDSFRRTLSDDEILSLVPTVNSAVSNPSNWWRSVEQLYDYVIDNVDYAYDEPFPLPPTAHEFETNSYENTTSLEVFMSPTETLELQQGDCDDHAVLLYGLVAAYDKHVYETNRTLWIMAITFKEKAAHLAVAFPVSGGELTIIDPAGRYYTGWPGSLSSNDPYDELETYSTSWSSYGGIKYLTLYKIDGGVPSTVASGNIQEVAKFIQSFT